MSKKRLHDVFVSFTLIIFTLVCFPSLAQAQANPTYSPPATESFQGNVVGVSNGDTLTVMRDGQAVKVRLYGIDSPEKRQAFGTQAKQLTSELAFDKLVTVKKKDIDKYGRIVGDVILPDGRSLNQELVRAGLAWWYRKYAPDNQILKDLEAETRSLKKGLWADKNPIPPWEWRMRRGRIRGGSRFRR